MPSAPTSFLLTRTQLSDTDHMAIVSIDRCVDLSSNRANVKERVPLTSLATKLAVSSSVQSLGRNMPWRKAGTWRPLVLNFQVGAKLI